MRAYSLLILALCVRSHELHWLSMPSLIYIIGNRLDYTIWASLAESHKDAGNT